METNHTTIMPLGDGCDYCDRATDAERAGKAIFPNHSASSRCKSGGRNHCTCDACF